MKLGSFAEASGQKRGVNHVRTEPKDVSKLSSLFRRSSGYHVSLARSEIELFARGEINEQTNDVLDEEHGMEKMPGSW